MKNVNFCSLRVCQHKEKNVIQEEKYFLNGIENLK